MPRNPDKRQCKAKSKRTGERCKHWAVSGYEVCRWHGANPQNHGGAPKRNKNAVKTGEHETIWLDTLQPDERELYQKISLEVLGQIDEEIRLLTIRERRMLQRIAQLSEYEMTEVERSTEKGKTAEGKVDKTTSKQLGTLGQIQDIEDALTRVQARKAKFLELKYKIETGVGPDEDDDGLEALAEALEESARMLGGGRRGA